MSRTAGIILVASVALDQTTKAVMRNLLERSRLPLGEPPVQLCFVANAEGKYPAGVWLALQVCVAIALVMLCARSAGLRGAAIALAAGGACGNLMDRARGAVPDWICLDVGSLVAFNLADVFLVVGGATAAALQWRHARSRRRMAP